MMQKSMITYMTLAAPLLPGVDAVQSCLFRPFRGGGARTSPEGPIPEKFAIWNPVISKEDIVRPPVTFTATVGDATVGRWWSPKYPITFEIQGPESSTHTQNMNAKQIRNLFRGCDGFDQFPEKRKFYPKATAVERLEFLKTWLSEKVFIKALESSPFRQFHAKCVSYCRGTQQYQITFEGEAFHFQRTEWLDAPALREVFGRCRDFELPKSKLLREGGPLATVPERFEYLEKWLEGKVFENGVVNLGNQKFDYVKALRENHGTFLAGDEPVDQADVEEEETAEFREKFGLFFNNLQVLAESKPKELSQDETKDQASRKQHLMRIYEENKISEREAERGALEQVNQKRIRNKEAVYLTDKDLIAVQRVKAYLTQKYDLATSSDLTQKERAGAINEIAEYVNEHVAELPPHLKREVDNLAGVAQKTAQLLNPELLNAAEDCEEAAGNSSNATKVFSSVMGGLSFLRKANEI